ncbi:MAG: DNA translocase FtsK, partial [Candidatus Aphodousia sp.]|nr:DNA translocase FtsK [Candidatus Aphodousia sp.]
NAQAERAQQVQKDAEENVPVELPEPVSAPEVTTAAHPTSPVAIKAQAKVKQSDVALEAKQEPLFEDSSQPIRPSLRLFDQATNSAPSIDTASLGVMSSLIENKLASFGIDVKVKSASPGPVVTRYEIELAEGVKSSSVKSLESDLARVLSVRSVRVLDTVANTPYMGIEVPNPRRQIVKIAELLGSEDFAKSRANLPLCLGKRITGEPFVADLAKMPHLLVAGTTGSGKSVGVNSMILSLLYKFEPSQLRLILIDPKKVEFAYYEDIPHLLCPVVDQMEEAKHGLQWCVKEMERRYKLAQSIKVRNIESFNARVREARAAGEPLMNQLAKNAGEDIELEELPYIVVVVDELADLLIVDKKGVEESLIRLAQKARAAGIHLILATQRPSADVISGLLRTNIPTRAAFQVATSSDSRIILDQTGAENLLGYGDFLFKMPNMQTLERIQGAFVTDEELERVNGALRQMARPKYIDDVLVGEPEEQTSVEMPRGTNGGKRDPLFDQAVAIILDSNKCSVTYLQRRLGVGYPRAANIVDELEAEGIVSPADSSGRRTINARNNEEL